MTVEEFQKDFKEALRASPEVIDFTTTKHEDFNAAQGLVALYAAYRSCALGLPADAQADVKELEGFVDQLLLKVKANMPAVPPNTKLN